MQLKELLKGIKVIKIIGAIDVNISDVKVQSSSVMKGDLFISIKGENYDGHDYIPLAQRNGAVAVITQKECDVNITQVIVEDSRETMSIIAKNFYQSASDRMKMIAVIGTNGKTSTATLIKKVLDKAGVKCGLIGTPGAIYCSKTVETDLTTPDPLVLHRILFEMYKCGVEVVVMEVSAHAIYYNKVKGINFEVAIFTNFTQDHLDFFKDMDSYKRAKLKFFKENQCKYIVANGDDAIGREIVAMHDNAVSYGIDNPCDVFAIDVIENQEKLQFTINLFDAIYNVNLNLIGKFNVYNALGASSALALIGTPTKLIVNALQSFYAISGRLEKVYDEKFSIFVDYAHTPDGLKNSIRAIKNVCGKKVITVFGCGGNRDKEKRQIMGEISGELSDFTVITSDNPRFEEPMDIIYQVEKGVMSKTKSYVIVQDRVEAIKYAIDMAKAGDCVLVAGKGEEKYQEILGIKRIYNDKDTINEIIQGNLS